MHQIEAWGLSLGVYLDVLQPSSSSPVSRQPWRPSAGVDILVATRHTSSASHRRSCRSRNEDLVIDTNLKARFGCVIGVSTAGQAWGGKDHHQRSMFSIFGSTVRSAYPSSKGGIVQLTKSLAVAWAKYNIQVNCIVPGWLKTELTRPVYEHPEMGSTILQRTPAGRWGNPDDMRGIAIFLASQASDFITGQAIPVDGGWAAN